MSNPTFIDLPVDEQVYELKHFLKEQGQNISEEASPGGIGDDLKCILNASTDCWKFLNNEAEAEGLFHSIISILVVLPAEDMRALVPLLCKQVGDQEKPDKTSAVRLRIILALHSGIFGRPDLSLMVYLTALKLAKTADLIQNVYTDITQVKEWLTQWSASPEQQQELWRILHEAFLQSGQSDNARRAMLELLATHSAESAAAAREDAHTCIVAALKDPNTYLFDHLLTLKPVKFLEGSPIHDLLTIFVNGKLQDFIKFQESNKDFVNSIGLNSEASTQKMRVLSFLSMAEAKREMPFDVLVADLQITEDDLEQFLIDVIRTRKVGARIDQTGRKVLVQNATHRTFGRPQWQNLREQLSTWRNHLDAIDTNLAQTLAQ